MGFSIGDQFDSFLENQGLVSKAVNSGENTGASSIEVDGSAFLFHIARNTTVEHKADITDHFVEDSSFIQDHIALKPLTLSLKGYVGELFEEGVGAAADLLTSVNEKLSIVDSYLPDLTGGVTQKINEIGSQVNDVVNFIDGAIAQGENLLSLVGIADTYNSKQKRKVVQLEELFFTKSLVMVNTPFGVYENMVIESIVAIQLEESKHLSDIEVRLKQIRTASTSKTAFASSGSLQGRVSDQLSSVTDNGKTQGALQSSSNADSFMKAMTGN